MSSIPADPSMVLGQIVNQKKLQTLKELGKILEPQQDAREKLNSLMLANYNLKELYHELGNMGASETIQPILADMKKKMDKLKEDTAHAAVDLANKTISCQTAAAAKRTEKTGESTISDAPESPFDMNSIRVTSKPFATDSINFDVQYFSNEKTTDVSSAVSQFVSDTLGKNQTGTQKAAGDAKKAVEGQYSYHKIEGTMVIVASCTHKKMNVVEGNLDAQKTLNAWNKLFPDDYLTTSPRDIFEAAKAKPSGDKKNTFRVLTGATYSSTFVGFVHILQEDESDSSQGSAAGKGSQKQDAKQLQNALKEKINQELMLQDLIGGFGVSDDFLADAKALTSSSKITSHCSMICQGAIPNIGTKDYTSVMKSMQPNTADLIAKQQAIAAAASSNGTSGTEGNRAQKGQEVLNLEKQHIEASFSALQQNNKTRKIMDMESLLDAFTDYLTIARGSDGDNQAGGGIPVNFYMKEIDKALVANTYVSQFYPDGPPGQGKKKTDQAQTSE
mmetsp:Transcript_10150/g.14902  ORF Transcript_10150/g.14902 Transcript_10150/m.14902 type:complete len:503 (+) Transcript_10150:117-1625(+)